MAYYAVTYTYSHDTERQDALRADHRAYLRKLAERGNLKASGPLMGTDPKTALLVFRADDEDAVRHLLAGDPFQQNSLVARTDVVQWDPVVGIFADRP